MRSLFRISLAILAVSFLVGAGSAFAQDKPAFTLTGKVGAAFGEFTLDKSQDSPNLANGTGSTAACGGSSVTTTCSAANKKGFTEGATSWESNIQMQWQTTDFTAISRIRIRGSNEQSGPTAGVNGFNGSVIQSGTSLSSSANDVYIESWWTPGNLKLGVGKFQGQAWSQPISGQYEILNPLPGSDNEYTFNWTGVSGLDAEYNLGFMQAGVAVSSQCKPSCNVAQTNATARSEVNGGSLVPHINGTVGSLSFRAQFPQTWGQYNNTAAGTPIVGKGSDGTKAVSGSGYMAGVQWASGDLKLSVDVGSFVEPHLKELQAVQGAAPTCSNAPVAPSPAIAPVVGVQCKDRDRELLSFRADIPAGPGRAMIGYNTLDDNNYGSFTYTTTSTTLRYYYPVSSFGWIVPEYRATTVGGGLGLPVTPVITGQPNTNTINALNTKAKDTSNSEYRLILYAGF